MLTILRAIMLLLLTRYSPNGQPGTETLTATAHTGHQPPATQALTTGVAATTAAAVLVAVFAVALRRRVRR